MRNFTFFILLLVISPIAGLSQQVRGGALFVKTGYSYTSGINSVFGSAAAKEKIKFKNQFISVGGELSYRRNAGIYILDANLGAQGDQRSGSTVIEPFSGFVLLKYGFIVYESKKFAIYPAIGGGCSLLFLTSYEKQGMEYVNQQTWHLISPGAEVGFHVDFMPRNISGRPDVRGGGLIGIRMGARFTSVRQEWRNKMEELSDYRSGALIGFTAGFVVGLGEFKYLRK